MAKIPSPAVRGLATIAERMARDMPNHRFALSMQGEVNRLRLRAEALDNVRATRNPLDTPAAHALKVAKMARQLDQEVTASMNRVGQILREGTADIQRRIAQKVDLTPNEFAAEIRAKFDRLDPKARAEFIKQLVTDNDGPALAAIVRAPSILSGISEATKAAYEKMIITRHAGAEHDELAAFEEVFGSSNAAHRTAGNFATSLINPSEIAKIEREAAEADAATASFNQPSQ